MRVRLILGSLSFPRIRVPGYEALANFGGSAPHVHARPNDSNGLPVGGDGV